MTDSPDKVAHLGMIQGVINRLSGNSFYIKGWSVALVTGLFALAAKDSKPDFVCVALLPVIIFWCLDGYFLRQERLFRKLYCSVSSQSPSDIDFSMNIAPFEQNVHCVPCVMFSKTLLLFHGVILSTVLIVATVLFYKGV